MNKINLAVMFKRYWLVCLLIGLISASIGLVATFVLSSVYQADVNIYIMPREDALVSGVMVNPKQPFAQSQAKMLTAPEVLRKTVTRLKLDKQKETSTSMLGSVIRTVRGLIGTTVMFLKYGYVKEETPYQRAVTSLESNIEAKVLEDTSVIQLAVSAGDPHVAALTADEVARQFFAFNRNKNKEEMEDSLAAIKAEVDQSTKELESVSQQLSNMKSSSGVVQEVSPLGGTVTGSTDQAQSIMLEKEVAIKENSLTYWQDLYQTTQSKMLAKQDQIRILGPAKEPVYPVRPIKILYAAIGFLVGVLIALVVAFVIEVNNKIIYTSDDIESALGVKVLADTSDSDK